MRRPGIVRECEHPGKPHAHGLDCYRRDKCRCPLGRAAVAEAKAKERKARALRLHQPDLVDPTGTRRRIEALITLGYTTIQIGEKCGLTRRGVSDTLHHGKYVRASTRDAVARLYDEWWDKPTPDFGSGRYMRGIAAKRGYLPPLAWDDDDIDDPLAEPNVEAEVGIDWAVVERAVKEQPLGRPLTKAERKAAVRAAIRKGVPLKQVIERFHIKGATVHQYMQEAA